MRRIGLLLLGLCLTVGVVGCEDKATDTTDETTTPETTPPADTDADTETETETAPADETK
jgi:hypothetical protein